MAKEVKRLYRSDDGIVAGVCAGIAEYCDIDPVIVRILTVLLSISSFGAVALAYVLLWLVMPRRVSAGDPISCDAYVRVNAPVQPQQPASPAGSRPIPPVGHEAWNASYGTPSGQAFDDAGQAAYAARYEAVAQMSAQDAARREAQAGMGGTTRFVVWVGILLLFVGVAALLSSVVVEVSWWQLWPCLVILAGIVEMVVPSRRAFRIRRFSRGLVIFFLGILLLLITVHLLSWHTIPDMLRKLWPLLVIALGLLIISRGVGNELLSLAAALCVVAMFVCGATLLAVPGTLEQITIQSPLLGTHVFDVNPWY